MSTLRIEVHKVKGHCPVYKKGDTFLIKDSYKLSFDLPKRSKRSQRLKRTKRFICMHSLASIMPYYVALSRGISPKSLGLSKAIECPACPEVFRRERSRGDEPDSAYVQCLDPCEYTDGGTVVFKITMSNKTS